MRFIVCDRALTDDERDAASKGARPLVRTNQKATRELNLLLAGTHNYCRVCNQVKPISEAPRPYLCEKCKVSGVDVTSNGNKEGAYASSGKSDRRNDGDPGTFERGS